ncbi:MAG: undecaprenyl-diphosphate phosphatase [Candidatus Omnitrophica bacterium]|nr:undecaprenyl-diphosphate phosphatase [Candidatus Omnitrophota bacterium]
MIGLFDSIILGIVEGISEFLPISSTGHLILVSHWLGLTGRAVKSFEIVIQGGALLAILLLYRHKVISMGRSLRGRDSAGRRLLVNLFISFLPAALAGAAFHDWIKNHLFEPVPVVWSLALGGVVMIFLNRGSGSRTLESLSAKEALWIGLAQCLALWPGTSRSMVTIVAALLLGFPATAAAEYSFLLAIPTLGGAAVFELVRGEMPLVQEAGMASFAAGFLTAAVVAAIAVKGFVRYLTTRGLAVFGWYRIILAAAVFCAVRGG